MLSAKFINFLAQPNGMGMGTIDARNKPEFHRVMGGAWVADDVIKIFIDRKSAGRTLDNLLQNPHMALIMVSMYNFESYQFKGKWLRNMEFTPEDQQLLDRYMSEINTIVKNIGLYSEQLTDGFYRYAHSDMIAMEMRVEEIFEQTPKKGTGEKVPASTMV